MVLFPFLIEPFQKYHLKTNICHLSYRCTDSSGGNEHVIGFSHTCVENAQHLLTYSCGDAAIYLLGISPTYFASFSQQFASFPHQNCFIYPKKCCIFPTVYCISPTNCFISPTVCCVSLRNFVPFCQKKKYQIF